MISSSSRGHSSSMYLDVGLMALGGLMFLAGDALAGLPIAVLGVLIHVAMGD